MLTATKLKIDIVQRTTSDDVVSKHAYRFFGNPIDDLLNWTKEIKKQLELTIKKIDNFKNSLRFWVQKKYIKLNFKNWEEIFIQ